LAGVTPRGFSGRESLWVASGQVLAALGGLLGLKIMTENLSPQDFGRFALLFTVATLSSQVIFGGVNLAASRLVVSAVEVGNLNSYQHALFRVAVRALALLMGVFIALLAVSIVFGLATSIQAVFLSLVYSVASSANSVFTGVLISIGQQKSASKYQVLEVWIRVVVLDLVFRSDHGGLEGAIAVYAVTAVVIALYQKKTYRQMFERGRAGARVAEDWAPQMYRIAALYMPGAFIVWAQQASDRWALELFQDSAAVGAHAVLYQLGFSSMVLIFGVGIRVIQPFVYSDATAAGWRSRSSNGQRYSRNLILVGCALGSVAFLAASLFHDQLFGILVGSQYNGFSYLLPWVVFAAIVFGLSEVLALGLQGRLRVRRLAAVKVSVGFAGVLLSFFGAWVSGLQGVIAALVVYNLLHFLALAVAYKAR
jgi:O-antigen/teichoic acid export membrane protein